MSATPVERFEVEDRDPAALLEVAAANEREIRERELLRLRLAYQWAIGHPATPDTGIATPGGPALDVLDGEESLGGDGTPPVAAFTPEPFAAAIGQTPPAAARLIGDALDLRHRLPLLWKRVQRLEVPAWQARRVAQQTRLLSKPAAAWVDDRLARTGCGPVVVDRLVAQAAAEFDPASQQTAEEQAQANWHVTLSDPDPTDYVGTSHLDAIGDTPTLREFHDLVSQLAHQLLTDGDSSPLGVRKIKALRLITHAIKHGRTLEHTTSSGPSGRTGKMTVYVRVDADDLDTDADGGVAYATGEVERLGAATLTRIRHWVGHHQVVIQPVLNLQRGDAVDVHDPPAWMRELVILRDDHCVFPGCTRDARACDIDHIIPYEDGPPGQTHPDNLACLCRRHHRAKTAGAWRYHRTAEGHYLWRGPYGRSYLVTPDGTVNLLVGSGPNRS
jgi:hypothetical protein